MKRKMMLYQYHRYLIVFLNLVYKNIIGQNENGVIYLYE